MVIPKRYSISIVRRLLLHMIDDQDGLGVLLYFSFRPSSLLTVSKRLNRYRPGRPIPRVAACACPASTQRPAAACCRCGLQAGNDLRRFSQHGRGQFFRIIGPPLRHFGQRHHHSKCVINRVLNLAARGQRKTPAYSTVRNTIVANWSDQHGFRWGPAEAEVTRVELTNYGSSKDN